MCTTMSLRKIFCSSNLLKRSPIFKQFVCTNVCHTKAIANDNKLFVMENSNEDKLLDEFNSFSLNKMLLVMEDNEKVISGPSLILAMKKLYRLYKKRQDYRDKAKEVYSMLDMNVDKLNVSDAITLLNMLSKIKAKDSISAVQSLLERIKDCIQDLNFLEFRKLSLTLKNLPDTSLTRDLQKTLEKRFIIQVESEFDQNNIHHLESALYFTAQFLDDKKLLKLFIINLNNYKEEICPNTAASIFHSLCLTKQQPEGWMNLLQRVKTILTNNSDELDSTQIMFVLYLIGEKFRLDRREEFYDEKLCEALVKKVIVDDSGFDVSLSVLKSLYNMRFVNTELINYSCAAYFEKINLTREVVEDEFFKLMMLISSMAVTKYKTVFFGDIQNQILNDRLLLNCSYESLCILALNLANLDCYSPKLLNKVFDGKFNYAEQRSFLQWTFCKLYQKIKTNPNYNGPTPSESQTTSLKNFHSNQYKMYLNKKKECNDKILLHLQQGMGGPKYVKSNISSKLFHIIDHTVAFNKDGNPIPINIPCNAAGTLNLLEYVEDLKVPPNSQIVLILSMPSFWYTINTNELMSIHSCYIDTLRAMSYTVVDINEGEFEKIPAEERTTMLMNKIKLELALN